MLKNLMPLTEAFFFVYKWQILQISANAKSISQKQLSVKQRYSIFCSTIWRAPLVHMRIWVHSIVPWQFHSVLTQNLTEGEFHCIFQIAPLWQQSEIVLKKPQCVSIFNLHIYIFNNKLVHDQAKHKSFCFKFSKKTTRF